MNPEANRKSTAPGALTDEQWRAAWELYEAVLEASPMERAMLLSHAGVEVAAEVRLLLAKSGEGEAAAGAGDRSGERVGRFTLIGLIGRGGMAEVYLARDEELERPAALKFLSIGHVGGKSVERAIREAKAASAVNHPNIVTVYEVIRTGDTLAIAMELVEGTPLRHYCGRALDVAEVLNWGRQIASALTAAHAEGLAHLDLKPENIMVRNDGILKVLDFGLARFVEQKGSASSRYSGTLRYMSPEQYLSEDLTTATDVFTLGLVLSELLSGEHPFAAGTLFETAHAIATRPARSLSPVNKRIAPELDRLLLAMLDKSPAARPSAAQVVVALSKMAGSGATGAAAPAAVRRPRSRKWLVAVAAGVALAALWMRQPGPASTELVRGAGPDDPIPPRHFYAINTKGNVAAYVDDSTDSSGYTWRVERVLLPSLEGVNWAAFRKVFAGGDGVLYAITGDGQLKYFRLLDPWRNSGAMRWSADSNTPIGGGWNRVRDAAAMSRPRWAAARGWSSAMETTLLRNGVIWAFLDSGRVSLFQHGWAAGGRPLPSSFTETEIDYAPHYGGPKLPAGHSCSGCRVFEGGDGITFAVSKEGILWRYRMRASGEWAIAKGKATQDRAGVQIGHEWNMWSAILASPGAYSIEGYVSSGRRLSPGDPVPVRASTFSPAYTVRLLRLERRKEEASGLIDGRQVGAALTREVPAGRNFKKPQQMGMISTGAEWTADGPDMKLPGDARSGLYAAELTTPSGGRALAPFIVRPRLGERPKNIAVIANTMTWSVFNQWGGDGRAATEVSFERPLLEAPIAGGASRSPGLTDRNPRAFNQLPRAEVWITSWLDSLAERDPRYWYDAFSDLDLHGGMENLNQYKALVVQTLPQFWTDRMRDRLDAYLEAGGHLVYLAGKGLFQRVQITGEGRMRMPATPDSGCVMPAEGPPPFPANPCPLTDLFRRGTSSYPDGRSERAVVGLAYEPSLPQSGPPYNGTYFTVQSAHPFLMDGTGLQVGSAIGKRQGLGGLMAADWGVGWRLPGAVYREFQDRMATPSHATVTGLDLADSIKEARASIVFRQVGARGWVFSIGATSAGGVLAVDPVLQRVVQNALDAAIGGR